MSHEARAAIVERRAALLAELFLQDLGAELLPGPKAGFAYDFIVALPNEAGGTSLGAVEVQATERPVGRFFPLDVAWYERLANANVPGLLIVVDTKANRVYHGWPGQAPNSAGSVPKAAPVGKSQPGGLPVNEAAKEEIRKRLVAQSEGWRALRKPISVDEPTPEAGRPRRSRPALHR